MSEHFPKQKYFGGRVEVESDLSSYAAKEDLKKATDIDTSKFANKVDLSSLNHEVI